MAKNKHITEPDTFGYQVRIVRRGKESSRYFSHKLWGNKNKSLQAAIAWRNQMLVVLKGSKMRFLKPPKNKTTTGVTGVSRTIKYDHRKDKSYLCYTVFWVKDKKSRNKTFQVGNVETVTADDELHAFRTAKLFRSCYEYSIDYDLQFDDSLFTGWKKVCLYDLILNNSVIILLFYFSFTVNHYYIKPTYGFIRFNSIKSTFFRTAASFYFYL